MEDKIHDERLCEKSCIENIEKWKGYPNYRAEPRVDWILALAIPILIEDKFHSKCKLILPEFPLRKGTLDKNVKDKEKNRSVKVDFYCLLEDGNHILIELKTDSNSVNEKQLEYLKKAAEDVYVHEIFEGLVLIRNKTRSSYKEKYDRYITTLENNGIYNDENKNEVKVVISKDKKFKIVYITPKKINEVSKLNVKLEEIENYTLDDLTNILKKSDDEFIIGMANVMSNWK